MALLYYYDQNPFRIFLSCIFFSNLVILARSKVLICTRKRNPEDSGRSRKMMSSCEWPFSSLLLASSLLNSSFYFNHSGTLQSSAVVSYDIINIDKKLNLFALRQKNRVWPLQKIGKFYNYQKLERCLQLFVRRQNPLFLLFWQLSFVGSSYFANVTT